VDSSYVFEIARTKDEISEVCEFGIRAGRKRRVLQTSKKVARLSDGSSLLRCYTGQILIQMEFSQWNGEEGAQSEARDNTERCHCNDDGSAGLIVVAVILHTVALLDWGPSR
jgi:hypothetical protein